MAHLCISHQSMQAGGRRRQRTIDVIPPLAGDVILIAEVDNRGAIRQGSMLRWSRRGSKRPHSPVNDEMLRQRSSPALSEPLGA